MTPLVEGPRLASDHHLLPATIHQVLEGPAAGSRVLLVQPAGGLHARVLLDRGLDVSTAWYAGYPISWTSPSGERRPGYSDLGEGWHRGWAGGLVTTCGLRHIGPPAVGFGRHGAYSDCPAEEVSVRRLDRNRMLEVSGWVRETDGLDRGLLLRRTLHWFLDVGRLELRDEVINETAQPVTAPILYHLNLGHPFLSAASTTSVTGLHSGVGFRPQMGEPAQVPDEVVEHRARPSRPQAGLAVTAPELGLRARVAWRTAELGRAYTWRRREPGCYVHGIEPANAALVPAADDPWPVLEPGQRRTTGFDLTVEAERPSERKDHHG